MKRSLLAGSAVLLLWAACKDQSAGSGQLGSGGESAGQRAQPDPFAIPDNPRPPSARWSEANELAEDLGTPRHPSDGQGEAWLVDPAGDRLVQGTAVARTPGSWTLHYAAGEPGIAVGGALLFLPEPFWGWSAPQVSVPGRLGYTRVTTDAPGVELVLHDEGPRLRVEIGGRALEAGEVVRIEYGADGAGALADTQAEKDARLWISVDGDGDGVPKVLAESPSIQVAPGPPAMLELLVRGAARVGSTTELVANVLDAYGNPVEVDGTLELSRIPKGWEIPAELPLQGGRASHSFECLDPGIVRLSGRIELEGRSLEDEANPLWIGESAPRVLWADLHGHSGLSDGTGTPEDWYRYARDVALLDVAALTDHDHFGVLFLDQSPELWNRIQGTTAEFHEPGRFVTVLGYEWTSWIHGHRHVLHFEDTAPLRSSLDPAFGDPRLLANALKGEAAMLLAHHTAGEPVATNWSFAPDPEVEPLVEVLSVHGSSEARDAPRTVRGARDGYFVRDQLARGVRFGFVGSGDSHDGHPGLAHLSPMYGARPTATGRTRELGTGGLAGILCEERTRPAVLSSLRARRAYATSGPRTLLRATVNGVPSGQTVALADLAPPLRLDVIAVADGHFERIDLVTSWDGVRSQALSERTFQGSLDLVAAEPGGWAYLRLLQTDRGQVLSSPIFFE